MASTNTTPNLGLNRWIDSDKPKRSDFVADNDVIDNVLGTHIAASSLHLAPSEKTRVGEPFALIIAYGTGEASTELNLGFSPKLVLVFKRGAAPYEISEGNIKINSAILTSRGVTSGATLAGSMLTLTQSSASNGVIINLNENNALYVVVAFR